VSAASGRRPLPAIDTAGAFAGRRVLVTGHTGFKGSWLSLWLHRLGAAVSGFALDPATEPSNFTCSELSALFDHDVRGDIRDVGALRELVRAVRPEVVFHLAGQPLVRAAHRDPIETFGVNVMGTAAVLDAVRLEQQPCVVIAVTSDKCYENQDWPWGYRETDRLGGSEPYGASKAAAELVAAAYLRTYFPPERAAAHGVLLASVRAGNVIGGGDWSADRIVPDIVAALSAGRPVEVRFPGAVRPWQHVLDPLAGYMRLAAGLLTGALDPVAGCGGWNFGPRSSAQVSVRELVDEAISCWGSGRWVEVADPLQVHEARLLHLSIDRALSELRWQPVWGFTESIRRTIAWYRAALSEGHSATRQLCLDDVAAYEAAASQPVTAGARR
jgi:CDP-glucose 4,6-dehydratase